MPFAKFVKKENAIAAGFSWPLRIPNLQLKREGYNEPCPVYLGRDDENGRNLAIVQVGDDCYFSVLSGRPPEQMSSQQYQKFILELQASINETTRVRPEQLDAKIRAYAHRGRKRESGGAFYDSNDHSRY